MKKRNIIICSICAGALVIAGLTLGIVFGTKASKDDKEKLYQQGVTYLVDGEFEKATEIFTNKKLKNYKDTSKKYVYSFNLQRYEQRIYSYEDLINFGLSENGSIANVDFNTDGGEEIARKTINAQQSEKYITEVAVKPHYDFVSWGLNYAGYERETDSIRYVLEAKYSNHPYLINYELNGGTSTEVLPEQYYYKHGDVTIPNLSKKGYEFLGYENDVFDDTRVNLVIPNGTAKDVNLSAKFEGLTYHDIELRGNGGIFDDTPGKITKIVSEVKCGEDYSSTFPVPTRNYYEFDHWTYNGETVDLTNWNVAEDGAILIAQYRPVTYSISYILNGAHIFGLPTGYNCIDKVNIPNVEKNGAIFTGWKKVGSLEDEKPNLQIGGTGSGGDVTLEAIFAEATIEGGKLKDINNKTEVKNMVIPSYVTDISNDLIWRMNSLLNIYVAPANSHFKLYKTSFSLTDDLLVKDGHIALAYPRTHSPTRITIPNCVDVVEDHAFKKGSIQYINYESPDYNPNHTITKIGNNAFLDCDILKVANFAKVETVGNNAFENTQINEGFLETNASTLTHVGDCAFKGTKINEINFGTTVKHSPIKHIGNGAFSNLNGSGFNSVTLYVDPNCEFGSDIFDGCSGITTLNTDTRFLKALMSNTFDDHSLTTINLNGSTNVGSNACDNYSPLTTLNLSSTTITQVDVEAFKNDANLSSVTLPTSIKRIQSSAFEGCGKLSSVNFGALSQLMRIESDAFKGSAFTSLDFTANTSLTLADHAFTSSSKLTSIKMRHGQITTRIADVFDLCNKIDSVIYEIPETSDAEIVISDVLFEELNNVTNVTLKYCGSSSKKITFGIGSFRNCAALTGITFQNCYISSVSNYCFAGCVSLTNTDTAFSNLSSYGDNAFYGCTNLSKISFTGTDNIGKEAFAGCYSLYKGGAISIPHNDSLIIGQSAFSEITGALEIDYSAADVSDFRTTYEKWYHFDDGFSGTITYLR